ncbi:MAG TPA: M56 family metallopeptidase [Gemmataceae bacterium]|nr:M56 family metallopeptidase [Gemmataceae bacterium]
MQTLLEIGLSNIVLASAGALVAAGIGFFSVRPAVRHTLWLLVLLKLITPPVLPIHVAYPSVLEAMFPVAHVIQTASSTADPGHDWPSQYEEDSAWYDTEVLVTGIDDEANPPPTISENSGPVSALAAGLGISDLVRVIVVVWLTGAIVWFILAGMRIYRFHRLLRFGRAAPRGLQDETAALAHRLGLSHCPTVWLVPGRVSPLLWALGRRVYLVLPVELLGELGPEQRRSLLAHELAHARRRDHWVRWLEFAVAGLYWWWPVAWWARRQLQQAEEECCDAWVVWTLPAVAKAYAKALLQTVDFLDARAALPPVASGIGHVHLLKRRLTMIVRQPSCPRMPWPVHLAVVVIGLLFLSFAPQRLAAQSTKDEPAPVLSGEKALVRAEQDSYSRDTERRLRTLEEKMDLLMQKLDAQRGEKPGEKPGTPERAAMEKARAAQRKAMLADEKAKTKESEKADAKDWKRRLSEGEKMTPEQIQRLIEEIQTKVKAEVAKSVNPERMEQIQRRVDEALKRSSQQLNEAIKRSNEQMERAKTNLGQAKKAPPAESRPERVRDNEQRDLERRMERLEQKMDRVLQALEKQGKPTKF